MSLDVQKKHEIVFLLLYSAEQNNFSISAESVDMVSDECKISKKHVVEAKKSAEMILTHLSYCDQFIKEHCKNYSFDRIYSIDRNILRLAIYEIMIEKQLPHAVIIAEAKRLAKKFSTEESSSFIHAFLGNTVSILLQ